MTTAQLEQYKQLAEEFHFRWIRMKASGACPADADMDAISRRFSALNYLNDAEECSHRIVEHLAGTTQPFHSLQFFNWHRTIYLLRVPLRITFNETGPVLCKHINGTPGEDVRESNWSLRIQGHYAATPDFLNSLDRLLMVPSRTGPGWSRWFDWLK